MTAARQPNRLATETSLYLRQHATNPVDWYPWGPEALARARELDRPIFLSVGYSACHWCHVMEHESFEDEATAALLNEHFVCVKVDREERPDLDTIYMTALQVMTREGGGWPLSVFLAPDLKPFFAGTYYPPDDRYAAQGRPGFKKLLLGIHNAWLTQRDRVHEIGTSVVGDLQRMGALGDADGPVAPELLAGALAALRRSYDPRFGGFGSQPKFPHALELKLLLRLSDRFNDPVALDMVKHTLTTMARGGIYDQLGGGFARYSVDAKWLVPHFEKMLYDNALLASALAEAYQRTGDPFFRQIGRETLDYVVREMWAEGGAFFSTQDADSEGEEGKFYVWSLDELRAVLGDEDAEFACKVWGATRGGNFEGHNILFRTLSDADEAKAHGTSEEAFRARLRAVKDTLYAARAKRVWPGRDEKILTAWNGLMIAAFAQFGMATGGEDAPRAAVAADHILRTMRTADGRLYRTAGVGQPPKLSGYLEDYAILADALVTLYEATFEVKWLRAALELAESMLKHFADPNGPGFFFTADDHEELIARTKDLHDGSTPSGNAVAVTVLLRLAALTGRRDLAEPAERTLRGYRETMAEHPAASGQMLIALDFHLGPVQQVAIAGPTHDKETRRATEAVRAAFGPRRVVALHDPASGPPPAELAALFEGKEARGGAVTVYVCENFACRAPLTGAEAIESAFGAANRTK
ncbi:thioredoxin domain-containing protein [Gemmata sp. JC717]|uniref:thioredoxin domain-containing protein n=1 Tax=Gemmata algarum TaxID=2975278 RepID=UPI0021BB2D46|nr:thioredoxin domain-containing protein [Gemmata algarum]MDY3552987.1 thioredoxin domain-containing protein [Gemmata algarum]